MKQLFLDSNKRTRPWLRKLAKVIRHNHHVRELAHNMLFTRQGTVRSFFLPIYSRLKADEEAAEPPKMPNLDDEIFDAGLQQCINPHVTVVAMARNESRRAHDIMRHFCALFDRVIVIDHLSTDDTNSIVHSYDGINGTEVIVLRGTDQGYYQSEYMSACANALLREQATDWIFFLDFDEFLPFATVGEFHQALASLSSSTIVHMPWHNIALKTPNPPTLQGVAGIIGAEVSEYRKIALNARAIGRRRVVVAQGNHSASLEGEEDIHTGKPACGLFHIPALSHEALHEKVVQGLQSMNHTHGKGPKLGYHWFEMSEIMDGLDENEDLFREMILNYSTPLRDIIKNVAAGNFTKNCREIILHFAQSERPADVTSDAPICRSFSLDSIDALLGELFPTFVTGNSEKCALANPTFEVIECARPSFDMSIVLAASSRSSGISPVPSENFHLPFLLGLLEIFQPRCYLQLGAWEEIFFQVSQLMRARNYGKTVLVDDWPHDVRADTPEDAYFMACKKRMKPLGSICSLIRGASYAPLVFEASSVDCLVMACSKDYATTMATIDIWKNKLSPQSLIILYNNGIHDSGFGVWQVYSQMSHECCESFQFFHNGGLGVLALGDEYNNPAIPFLRMLSERGPLAEYCYGHIGKPELTAVFTSQEQVR